MQRKKGISLIVLVITIIVMIILATAIIISLNNSGIINKANEAVDKTNEAQVQQIAQLGWAEAYAEYGDNVEKLTEGVRNALTANGINPDDYEITVTKTGVTLSKKQVAIVTPAPEEWKENVKQIVDGVPIPNGFVASSVAGENLKATGLVIYEGEEAVTAENHYDALRTRNQYVWVPVPDYSQFVRRTFGENVNLVNTIGGTADDPNYGYGLWEQYNKSTYADYWEVVLDENNIPTDTKTGTSMYTESAYTTSISQEEWDTINAMYASVKKYGGFYTARYETGKDVVSIMNAVPAGDRTWAETKYLSRDSVTETKIYGVQWDTTLQWITDSGLTLSGYTLTQKIELDDLNEGAKYGTYIASNCYDYYKELYDDDSYEFLCGDETSVVNRRISEFKTITSGKNEGLEWYLTTGALKSAKQNNIYDMLGNYREVTNEKFSGVYGRVNQTIRNGIYRIADRWSWDVGGFFNVATRSALYIND